MKGPRGNCNCFQVLLDERKASSLQLLCIKEMRLYAGMHRTQGRSVLSCYSFNSDCRNVYWLSILAFCPRSQDPQTTRNHSQEKQVRADTVRSKRFLTWQSTLETSLTVILLQSRCSHQSCKRPTWDCRMARMARTRENCVTVQSYYTTLYQHVITSSHFMTFVALWSAYGGN